MQFWTNWTNTPDIRRWSIFISRFFLFYNCWRWWWLFLAMAKFTNSFSFQLGRFVRYTARSWFGLVSLWPTKLPIMRLELVIDMARGYSGLTEKDRASRPHRIKIQLPFDAHSLRLPFKSQACYQIGKQPRSILTGPLGLKVILCCLNCTRCKMLCWAQRAKPSPRNVLETQLREF